MVRTQTSQPDNAPVTAMQNTDFEHLQILLVDDSRHFLEIVGQVLRGFGVRTVVKTTDAADAMERLKVQSFDVIVADLNMPLLDGFEFTRFIRADIDSPNARVPIILLTAHANMSVVKKAIDIGVDGFVAKPMRPIDLMQRLLDVVDRPRPYISVPGDFFGPCRRRRDDERYAGPERRAGLRHADTGPVEQDDVADIGRPAIFL